MTTWKQLKEFCNGLNEDQLEKNVMLWREYEAVTDMDPITLEEDQYIDKDNPEIGCFPVSEAKDLDKETKIKKVYSKGHPVFWKNF